MYIKLLKLPSRYTKNLIPVNMVFLLLHHSSLLHLSGGTPEKRGRGSKEEGRWRRQEEESAVWHGSELWRLPGQGWTAVEMMVTVMKRRWWYRGWLRNVCVCCVCCVPGWVEEGQASYRQRDQEEDSGWETAAARHWQFKGRWAQVILLKLYFSFKLGIVNPKGDWPTEFVSYCCRFVGNRGRGCFQDGLYQLTIQ